MDMEDRIAVLEKDVDAIESELAVMRYDRALAMEMSARVSRIELDWAVVKGDISHVRRDVSLLQGDVFQLRKDVSDLQTRLAQPEGEVGHLRDDVRDCKRSSRPCMGKSSRFDSKWSGRILK